jgi:hypothetical protein
MAKKKCAKLYVHIKKSKKKIKLVISVPILRQRKLNPSIKEKIKNSESKN